MLAAITYGLSAEVEKLVLTGIAAIDGSGNALANEIVGNGAANQPAAAAATTGSRAAGEPTR